MHARIQVNLGITRDYAALHEVACLSHCAVCLFRAPNVGPKVISTQEDVLRRKFHLTCKSAYECSKITRSLSCIATKLIDLVGSRLDAQQAAISRRLHHSSFQDVTICRTDRINSGLRSSMVSSQDSQQFRRCGFTPGPPALWLCFFC